jgi:hypothetical protein
MGIIWGKFAIGHRYFLAFAKTHCSIVALPKYAYDPKWKSCSKLVIGWLSQQNGETFLF